MGNLTPEQLLNAATVVLLVMGAIVTIDKVIDIVKKWKTPSADTAKKLATDKARLDEHERAIKDLEDCNQVLCAGILALLDHELHNGNADQMQRARDDIMQYLQRRIIK